ncbi:MAG: hypothetical protein DME04_20945 [Candidatus Rokuibacteriota bacterium]|nr:MAG: hypothetical protein DME04_20945 [Candidatus Rokubacteria bacterium]
MRTSSRSAFACCGAKPRRPPDGRQLVLRARGLRARRGGGAGLLANARPPRERPRPMNRHRKFIVGGAVIACALAYMIYAGVTQSAVYFVTPGELRAAPVPGKAYRLGGMVVPGSLRWEPRTLDLSFTLSDGTATVPIRHKGTPPDLFGEGRGAVVEGSWVADGYFRATLIMAKHSEEYKAPHDASAAGYKELIKTLRGDGR